MTDTPTAELRAMLAEQTRDPGRLRTVYDCASACGRGTAGRWCAECLRVEIQRRSDPNHARPTTPSGRR